MIEQPTITPEIKEEPDINFCRQQIEKNNPGVKLPEDNEKLFVDFDQYVSKDFKSFLLATDPPRQINRESIKHELEKGIYGITMDDVKNYFNNRLKSAEKMSSRYKADEEDQKYLDEAQDIYNQVNTGSLDRPMEKLEQEMSTRTTLKDDKETIELRQINSRLYAELNAGRPKPDVKKEDIVNFIKETKQFYENSEDEQSSAQDCDLALEAIESGDYSGSLIELDKAIGHIQQLKADVRKEADPNRKMVIENALKENYGTAHEAKLNELRGFREHIIGLSKDQNKDSEQSAEVPMDKTDNEETDSFEKQTPESSLEKEKKFMTQIENNAHKNAKLIKEEMYTYLSDIDNKDIPITLPDLKNSLDDILYRSAKDYSPESPVIVDEQKAILGPLADFRKELDTWNTFPAVKVEGFRKKIVEYLNSTFGVAEYVPREGDKVTPKSGIRSVKNIATDNKLLDKLVKKVVRPGYKLDDELLEFHNKYHKETKYQKWKEFNEKKSQLSPDEIDKLHDEITQWEHKYMISSTPEAARVEMYKYG